ncbi:hypothetical protein HanIR_Chr02g0072491 [Helianthus annuus]|nr:hypothetical protein HanIR_Chr02g0072491 [Helianthus annuus]
MRIPVGFRHNLCICDIGGGRKDLNNDRHTVVNGSHLNLRSLIGKHTISAGDFFLGEVWFECLM